MFCLFFFLDNKPEERSYYCLSNLITNKRLTISKFTAGNEGGFRLFALNSSFDTQDSNKIMRGDLHGTNNTIQKYSVSGHTESLNTTVNPETVKSVTLFW